MVKKMLVFFQRCLIPSSRFSCWKPSKSFSLVELLVVISMLAILASLLFPSYTEVRYRAEITDCKNRLNSLHIGMNLYVEDYHEYPRAYISGTTWANRTKAYHFGLGTSNHNNEIRETGSIVELMRPYFESQPNTLFCPSVNVIWPHTSSVFAKTPSVSGHAVVSIGYNIYPGYCTAINENHKVMKKRGDTFTFTPWTTTTDVKFNILASDLTNTGAGHMNPRHARTISADIDIAYWTGEVGSLFENNFVFEDGSVKLHQLDYQPNLPSGNFYRNIVASPASDRRLLLPREYQVP
jgi:type II secretory pathway pseudopilin PulG